MRPPIRDPRQIDLEDWLSGAYRMDDPDTSVKAARSVNVQRINRQILRALHLVGGLTTEELATIIKRPLQSVTPRMRPLEKFGLVQASHRTRKGKSGRDRIIWEPVDANA